MNRKKVVANNRLKMLHVMATRAHQKKKQGTSPTSVDHLAINVPPVVDSTPLHVYPSPSGLSSVDTKLVTPSSVDPSTFDQTSQDGTLIVSPVLDAVVDKSKIQTNVSSSESSDLTETQDFVDVKIKEENDERCLEDKAKISITKRNTSMETENTLMEPQNTAIERENVVMETETTQEGLEKSELSTSVVNSTVEQSNEGSTKSSDDKDHELMQHSNTPSECSESGSERQRGLHVGKSKERAVKPLQHDDGHIGTKPKIRNVRPGFTFEPGVKVEAMDYLNKWYAAKIVRVDWDAEEVQIHFEGWNARYDEWVDFQSERLRPAPRHSVRRDSCPEGVLRKPGEQVLARWTDCRFYPAQIISINANGSYQVLFYDGIKKTVQAMNIRDLPPSLHDKSKKTKDGNDKYGRRKERSQSLDSESPTAPKRRLSGNNSTPVQSKRVRHESISPRLKGQALSPRSHSSSSASSNTSLNSSLGSPSTSALSEIIKKSREPLITDKEVGLLRDPNRKLAPKEMVIDLDHNKYKCDIAGCGKAFRKGSLLDYHKKYYHIGAKPSSYASAASKALNRSRKRLSTPGVVTGAKKSSTPQPAKVQRLRSSAPAALSSKTTKKIQKPNIYTKSQVSPTSRVKSPLPAKVSERLKAQGEKKTKIETLKKEQKPVIRKSLDRTNVHETVSKKTLEGTRGSTLEETKVKNIETNKGKTIDGVKGKKADLIKTKIIDGSNDTSEFGKALTRENPKSADVIKTLTREKPKSGDVMKTRRLSGKEEKFDSKVPDKKWPERVEDRKKTADKIEKDRVKDAERSKGEKNKSADKYRSSSSSDRGRSTDKDRSEHRSSRHHHEKHKKSHKSHRHRDRDSDGSYKHNKKEESRHHRRESSSYISQTEEIYVRELTSDQKMQMETSEEGVQTEEVYREEVVHCVCKINEEDGFMIQCDSCFCWQHSICVGLNQVSVPKKYICCFCQNPSGERTNAKYQHNQHWFKTGELPQFSFSNDRSHNASPTMMLAAHKLASDIHGVNAMLQRLHQKLMILQKPEESKEELKMWSKWWGVKVDNHKDTDFENFRLSTMELEEVDSSVDSSVHGESLHGDLIMEDEIINVDTSTDLPIETSKSMDADAVSTSVKCSDNPAENVTKSCETTESKDDEIPCDSTSGTDMFDNQPTTSDEQSGTSACQPNIGSGQSLNVGDQARTASKDTAISDVPAQVSLGEDNTSGEKMLLQHERLQDNVAETAEDKMKEQLEEEIEVDVEESDDDDDEPLAILKEKWRKSSDETDTEIVTKDAILSDHVESELATKNSGICKDKSTACSDKETTNPLEEKSSHTTLFPKQLKSAEKDVSVDDIDVPSTSEHCNLKEILLTKTSETYLPEKSGTSKKFDSLSEKTPIQSSDIPSTSRNIPDIPLIDSHDISREVEKQNRLECQLNLLEHVTCVQDDLEERLALIEEQVTALESVQMIPQKKSTKDMFDDMPLAKRRLKMMMADLKKVCEVITT